MQPLCGLALDKLLQLRLIVTAAALSQLNVAAAQTQAVDQLTDRLDAAVEIHGGKDRLGGIGQNGGAGTAAAALLAAAQHQILAQSQLLCRLEEALFTHQRGAGTGQVTLGSVGEVAEQKLRRHKAQHRIPQELQTLVAEDMLGTVLVGIRAVIEGSAQQLLITECISQFFL